VRRLRGALLRRRCGEWLLCVDEVVAVKAQRVDEQNRAVASGLSRRSVEPSVEEVDALVEATRRQRTRRYDELTEMEQKIFVSVEREGMTPSELADFPDFPKASTIRTHLQRARAKRGNQS